MLQLVINIVFISNVVQTIVESIWLFFWLDGVFTPGTLTSGSLTSNRLLHLKVDLVNRE